MQVRIKIDKESLARLKYIQDYPKTAVGQAVYHLILYTIAEDLREQVNTPPKRKPPKHTR